MVMAIFADTLKSPVHQLEQKNKHSPCWKSE
jgi:hypothetical protein